MSESNCHSILNVFTAGLRRFLGSSSANDANGSVTDDQHNRAHRTQTHAENHHHEGSRVSHSFSNMIHSMSRRSQVRSHLAINPNVAGAQTGAAAAAQSSSYSGTYEYANLHIYSPKRRREIVLLNKIKEGGDVPKAHSGITCFPVHMTEQLDDSFDGEPFIEPPLPRLQSKRRIGFVPGSPGPSRPTSMRYEESSLDTQDSQDTGMGFEHEERRRRTSLKFDANSAQEDNAFLMFGGSRTSKYRDCLMVFDTKSQTWTDIKEQAMSSAAAADGKLRWPTPRAWHKGVTVEELNKIYIFGGYDGTTQKGDLYELDLNELSWQKIINMADPDLYHNNPTTSSRPGVPCPRNDCSLVLRREPLTGELQLIVFAGYFQKHLSDMYAFNVRTKTWSLILEAEGSPKPLPRSGHTSVMIQRLDRMLVYGGYGKDRNDAEGEREHYCGNTMDEFRFDNKTWVQIEFTSKYKPIPRRGHCFTPLPSCPDNVFIMFGGKGDDNVLLNDMHIFFYDERVWMQIDLEYFNIGHHITEEQDRKTKFPSAKDNFQMVPMRNSYARRLLPTRSSSIKLVIYSGTSSIYLDEMHMITWYATKHQFQSMMYNVLFREKDSFTDCDLFFDEGDEEEEKFEESEMLHRAEPILNHGFDDEGDTIMDE